MLYCESFEKMKNIIFIFFILSAGCAPKLEQNPELMLYVEKIYNEIENTSSTDSWYHVYVKGVSPFKMELKFGQLNLDYSASRVILGQYQQSPYGQFVKHSIIIDSRMWGGLSDSSREQLILHELVHAISRGRVAHDNRLLPGSAFVKNSVMSSVLFSDWMFLTFRRHYYDDAVEKLDGVLR